MNRRVRDFYGRPLKIDCEDQETGGAIVEQQIEPFREEIETAWLSGGPAEEHVKGYLSYIASLCIRKPATHNVLSYKKRKRIEANEVLVADISKSAAKGNRSASRLSREMKGRFPPTRFERMAALKRRHSPREVSIARVDVQGGFTCSHGRFRISPDAGQYLPQQTEQGLFYPMDQVVIMDCGSKLQFFDQGLTPIASSQVVRLSGR